MNEELSKGVVFMRIKGIAASDGIAISKVFKLEAVKLDVTDATIANQDTELEKLKHAIEVSVSELKAIREKTRLNAAEYRRISKSHIENKHITFKR